MVILHLHGLSQWHFVEGGITVPRFYASEDDKVRQTPLAARQRVWTVPVIQPDCQEDVFRRQS